MDTIKELMHLAQVIDTQQILKLVVEVSHTVLMPLMFGAWVLGILMRWLIYFTVRCEYRFITEFEKRVYKHLTHENLDEARQPFHVLAELLLQRTYYEHFELKRKYMRRRFDYISSFTDRIFLIQEGATRLVRDILKQTQYLKHGLSRPKFQAITQFVVTSNPIFNKIWGVLPIGMVNDVLHILPGLFVIGGIFGTFIGVMRALPALTGMQVSDVEATRQALDGFLLAVSSSMMTSITGILYSVIMSVLNATMSPESPYLNLVNKLTSSLEFLWNDTDPTAWKAQQETPANYFEVVRDPLLGANITHAPEIPVVAARKEKTDPRGTPAPANPLRWNQDESSTQAPPAPSFGSPPPAEREARPADSRRGGKKGGGGDSEAA